MPRDEAWVAFIHGLFGTDTERCTLAGRCGGCPLLPPTLWAPLTRVPIKGGNSNSQKGQEARVVQHSAVACVDSIVVWGVLPRVVELLGMSSCWQGCLCELQARGLDFDILISIC